MIGYLRHKNMLKETNELSHLMRTDIFSITRIVYCNIFSFIRSALSSILVVYKATKVDKDRIELSFIL